MALEKVLLIILPFGNIIVSMLSKGKKISDIAQWSKTAVWVEKSQNALKFPKIDMIYDILGYYLAFYIFTVFKQ